MIPFSRSAGSTPGLLKYTSHCVRNLPLQIAPLVFFDPSFGLSLGKTYSGQISLGDDILP
jgi:hypothetical protein